MPPVTVQQAFDLALHHHQAGRLIEAEALYRQILAVQPKHAAALHLLGLVAHQAGQNDVAVELIRHALVLEPNYPEALSSLGAALIAKGQPDEAIAAYSQAITLQANYPDAYYNLGNALWRCGRVEEAVTAYRRAIVLKPNFPEAHMNLGNVLREQGQLDGAIAAYRQAIVLQPDSPAAHYNLGGAMKDKGQMDEAATAYRRSIVLQPNNANAYCNLGIALGEQGQLDAAIAAYRQAIALQPNFPEAHNNLGNALRGQCQLAEAISAFHRAITLKPNYAEAYCNLGIALRDQGQLDAAIAAYRQGIALLPNLPEVHNNLANALGEKGQLDEAVAVYRQALVMRPNFPEAHYGLGNALWENGRVEEAIAAYRQALVQKPDFPDAHVNIALALLARGDFLSGWEEYEWRLKGKDAPSLLRNFTQPRWDGGLLDGRTLLLHAEQGFGDAIQFIRYLPWVIQRGGNIIIECQPELQRLFQRMVLDLPVIAKGRPLPAFEIHCPLSSLPRAFSTDLSNIPGTVPYLHADDNAVTIWQERLARVGDSLQVGLVWAGNPIHKNDRRRSLKLASLAPLAEVPGVRFISLQKCAAAAEARTAPEGMELIDVGDQLEDFADTAALLANLDLVITVDTAVAHLSGAMGKPVWTLVPFAPDFRWLLNRSDSPWYPTMRLFRQLRPGDWDSVIQKLAIELNRKKDSGETAQAGRA
jgi:Flp pilus assembly protein TadD